LILVEKRYLTYRRALRVAQAPMPQITRAAVALRSGELVMRTSVGHALTSITVERLACRTNTGVGLRVVVEIFRHEAWWIELLPTQRPFCSCRPMDRAAPCTCPVP